MWKKIRPTVLNAMLQAIYWACYCSLISYVSVFLKDLGMTDSRIGVVLALGNALSVALQPLIGNFADSKPKMILRPILVACILPIVGLYGIVLAGGDAGVCFVLMIALLQTMLPLLFSLCTFYMDRGVAIQFGISRGLGSLGYAIVSTILGGLIASFGSVVTVWFSIGTLLALAAVVTLFRFPGVPDDKPVPEKAKASMAAFLRENRRFAMLLVGSVLAYVGYNASSNFLYQIIVSCGLSSVELGYCLTLSSAVELLPLFLLTWLNRRFYSGHLLCAGALGMTLRPLIIALTMNYGGVMGAMAFQMAGYPVFASIGVFYVNQVVDESHQTLGQSLMNATFTAGNVIACLAGGWLLDMAGVRPMLLASVAVSAAGTAIVSLSAGKGKKLPSV